MGPAAAAVAKVALPVALLVGGGVAFAAAAQGGTPSEVRAWVDSPLDGATIAAGEVAVPLHASADDIDQIDLVVDGDVAATTPDLQRFGHLAKGEVTWTAAVGTHHLIARAHRGSSTTDSRVSTVLVVKALPAVAPLGNGPNGEVPSTTTTTAPPDASTTTTTAAEGATTTEPATTTTTTEAPLPDPPVIARLIHSPARGTPTTDITITAGVTGPDPATITVTIQARQDGADWNTLATCTASDGACQAVGTFGPGAWRYRAVARDAAGQEVTRGDDASTTFVIVA